MLRTRGLTKDFGGLTAVDSVDFELASELTSLIGPNGAGKTTFFNLLTGVLEPTAGSVELREGDDWVDITDAAPHETAQRGIHRSYQVTNVFPNSSVLENVRIAEQAAGEDSHAIWRNVDYFEKYTERAYSRLDRVGLADRAADDASTLSHGAKRKLEVAIALAGDPSVLLLDEPNAGVSSESVDEVRSLVEDVAADHAVLLVEHNMDIVMDVSERVVVLHQGRVIADGEPAAVRADPDVQSAYLGGYEPGDLDDAATDETDAGEGAA
ncbi:ABC transporter ATP-binding protein [Haloarcula marina]|uniref:ABC transporter ATP-binding protein n=1 Tax=Haloarcula marina TaxID=2961574 RepID=UPI0020B65C59|nr:ABC transporter ATP-binding protein [Halomicroarcula marina]